MDSLVDMTMLMELSILQPATFAIATLTTVMSLYIYFTRPCLILQAYFRVAVRWSGMRANYVKAPEDGFVYFYGEKGQKVKGQQTVLLLHGFTADHFMWAPIVQNMPAPIHVVALDLPGHGFTSDLVEEDDISLHGLTSRIKQFVDLLDLNDQPLHVVGVSMGGTLGGLFALNYPDLVGALTLTCPAMKTPRESHMILANKDKVLKDGGVLTLDNCPMLPQTPERMQEMLNMCHYYTISYPTQILKGVVDLRMRKNSFYLRLVRSLIREESQTIMAHIAPQIACPTQIIWGREDWIVDISGMDLLKEKLPNCQRLDTLVHCGHAINLDQPKVYAQRVLDFRSTMKKNAS